MGNSYDGPYMEESIPWSRVPLLLAEDFGNVKNTVEMNLTEAHPLRTKENMITDKRPSTPSFFFQHVLLLRPLPWYLIFLQIVLNALIIVIRDFR